MMNTRKIIIAKEGIMTPDDREYAFGRIDLAIMEIYDILDEETMEKIDSQMVTIEEALGELEADDEANGKLPKMGDPRDCDS